MATSAFRSTTRRGCQIGSGYGSSTEGGSVPSMPRSKRDPSPSGRTFHRRSSSVSDFSAKYLSDCSSTSEFRSSYNKRTGAREGRRSLCPSDSESDMDSLSAHIHLHRRWGAESEDERRFSPPIAGTKKTEPDRNALRRTLSSQDLSQNIAKRHEPSVLNTKSQADETEDLVEEKTIRAVYAQMKSLHVDPPAGDVGMMDFLDAMRSEVRRAVADIQSELKESMQKKGKLSFTLNERNSSDLQRTDVIQAVADIRNEYTTKLEESEKRVQELWSQIAVEERRCLELSKIVKELLPTEPPVALQVPTTHMSSNQRKPLRRKKSEERKLVLKSLDDEAQKYFDECVSISSHDCLGDSDDSMREKENTGKDGRGRGVVEGIRGASVAEDGKSEAKPRDSFSAGSDGVLLPWLQWDTEAGGDKNSKQVGKRPAKSRSGSTSPSSRQSSRGSSGNTRSNATRKLRTASDSGHMSLAPATTLGASTWNKTRVSDSFVRDLPAPSMLESSKSDTVLFMIDDGAMLTDPSGHADADALMFERIRLQCRVENGELLLCPGLFLM